MIIKKSFYRLKLPFCWRKLRKFCFQSAFFCYRKNTPLPMQIETSLFFVDIFLSRQKKSEQQGLNKTSFSNVLDRNTDSLQFCLLDWQLFISLALIEIGKVQHESDFLCMIVLQKHSGCFEISEFHSSQQLANFK